MFGEDLDLCYRLKLGGEGVLPADRGATHHLSQAPPEMQRQMSYERHRSMWAYHFKHHAEDVSASATAGLGSDLGPLGGARAREEP